MTATIEPSETVQCRCLTRRGEPETDCPAVDTPEHAEVVAARTAIEYLTVLTRGDAALLRVNDGYFITAGFDGDCIDLTLSRARKLIESLDVLLDFAERHVLPQSTL